MKKSMKLRKLAAEKNRKAKDILDSVDVLSEEMAAEVQTLLDEADELMKQAELAERSEKMAGDFDEAGNDLPLPGANGGNEGKSGDPAQPKDPNDRPFKNFGDQLQAIVKAAGPQKELDQRLLHVKGPTGSNTVIDSEGGFLIQEDFAQEIFKVAFETGILASRVRILPRTKGKSLNLPVSKETSRVTGSRWGGIQMYWTGEGDTPAPKKPEFDWVKFNLKKLMGIWYATEEILEDTPLLAEIGRQAFSEETATMLDIAIWEGSGVGQPLGMFKSPAKISVAKEDSQTADTVVAANLSKMWSRMPASCRKNAIWLYNQDVESQLFGLTVGNIPVFLPPGGFNTDPYGRIFGRPAMAFEFCETVGDNGDIAFVDPKSYGMIKKGDEGQLIPSMHVRFVYDEMVFKIRVRADGAPLVKSAITPAKGSNTLSPIVTLAARA